MANAYKDENGVPTLIAALNTTGTSIVRVLCNPTNHSLKVVDGATGSNNGPTNALHDDNSVPIFMATSSVDGFTPVAVYADVNGNLLMKST